jgi:transposase InsO family protein
MTQLRQEARLNRWFRTPLLDWFSRRVLSWRVSITMEASFCIAPLQEALAAHGKPDIFILDRLNGFTPVGVRLYPVPSDDTAGQREA